MNFESSVRPLTFEICICSDKKGGKSSKDQSRHDSSDDEDNPQSGKKLFLY